MSNAIPEDLRDLYENGCGVGKRFLGLEVKTLIERIAAAEAERDALKADKKALVLIADSRQATIERLSAPVSRHNEADCILQRYLITGGRQYRYTKQDATDLEALVKEWIAARKDANDKEKA
jgi:hypothetical protein